MSKQWNKIRRHANQIRDFLSAETNIPSDDVLQDGFVKNASAFANYLAAVYSKRLIPQKYKLLIDTAVCPECGNPVERQYMNGEILIHDQYNYCSNCGQAILWTD